MGLGLAPRLKSRPFRFLAVFGAFNERHILPFFFFFFFFALSPHPSHHPLLSSLVWLPFFGGFFLRGFGKIVLSQRFLPQQDEGESPGQENEQTVTVRETNARAIRRAQGETPLKMICETVVVAHFPSTP